MNWEGHEDWFLDAPMFDAFTSQMPKPLPKPWPSCAEMRARAKSNPSEQVAIPGANCHERR
ncbi:hypothetical protein [Aestuariivirga sp.]|uniref:hypothetical protein n=1 Tax=Aestuariivirga sp. TaxID=2650926 RepID=UPI0039E2EE36